MAAAVQGDPVFPHRGIITVCAMAATLMQALDSTIANVALPYMQGSLSASYDEITWVLTSYIVAAAIMTAPVGWLSARFGQKNLYLVSIIGFTVASMACGIATSLYEMVLYRLLQGVFGAALVPLSQGTMLNIYPAEQRGSAMALWGMGVMVGPILGPTLGGYLTELYNWRYVFYREPAVRHRRHRRSVAVPAGREAGERAALRLVWLRRARDRHRRDAAHARPRRDQGLVRLDRGHHRMRDRRRRLLPVHRAHDHRRAALHQSGDLPRPQLPDRRHHHVRRRDGAAMRPRRCWRRGCRSWAATRWKWRGS